MKYRKGLFAFALIASAVGLITPFDAMAFQAQQTVDRQAQLSMGSKPTPSALPDTTSVDHNILTDGLEKIAIRGISHPLEAGDPQGSAVQIVTGMLKGTPPAPHLSLHAKSDRREQLQGFGARMRKETIDRSGNRHIRIRQTYRGIPVVGAELIVHANDQYRVYRITGSYLPQLDLFVTPTLSDAEALAIGQQDLADKKGVETEGAPELVIVAKRLAYRCILVRFKPEPGRWIYYVDAHTGNIILSYNDLQSGAPDETGSIHILTGMRLAGEDGSQVQVHGWYDAGSDNYFLFNAESNWSVFDEDADDWEQQDTADWGSNDPAAVSAAKNLELTQAYVTSELGRTSFNDIRAMARAVVHYGTELVNAYWNGSQLLFGDGDGQTANALAVLDVVAHEFGHALTDYTSDLIYQDESGALNEAYSDIFGALVEFWAQPDGTPNYPYSTPGTSDWLLGEDSWIKGEALRNLKDPMAYNHPAFYQGTNWYFGSLDNGGVHFNSGVLNQAFYLLAEGGSGSFMGRPFSLSGIGITGAGRIAMRANLDYHIATDCYTEARQAWLDAADDLGHDPETVEAVFDSVGVPGPPPAGFGVDQPISTVNSISYPNQDFVTQANDAYDTFIADDVSFESKAALTEIYIPFHMQQPGRPIFNAQLLHFEIYADQNGRPDGDPTGSGNPPVWSESLEPNDPGLSYFKGLSGLVSNLLLTLDTPVTLAAGTYWLVVYPELSFASYGQSFRYVSDTANGSTAMVINPGDGFALPATWTPITAIGVWGVTQQDLAFGINATPYHQVNFTADTGGQIIGEKTQDILDGQDSTSVQAVADSGYAFDGWRGGHSGTDNPLILSQVDQDLTVTAKFVSTTSPDRDGGGSGGGAGCFLSTTAAH